MTWQRAIRDEWATFRHRPGVWSDALADGLIAYVESHPTLPAVLDLVAGECPRAVLPLLLDRLALDLGERDPAQDPISDYCREIDAAWDDYWHGCIGRGAGPYSDCPCCNGWEYEPREYLNGISRDGDDWCTCPCCYGSITRAWLNGYVIEFLEKYRALHYDYNCCTSGKRNCRCHEEGP